MVKRRQSDVREAHGTVHCASCPAVVIAGSRDSFLPADVEPDVAVVLIGGSGGSEPSYVGEALAGEGVAALSVAYFARPGLPTYLRGISLEYFFSAIEFLHAVLGPADVPFAVMGMSPG